MLHVHAKAKVNPRMKSSVRPFDSPHTCDDVRNEKEDDAQPKHTKEVGTGTLTEVGTVSSWVR